MTQKEFEARAIEVSIKEFEAINEVYMNCDLEKDEFCKIWCKMNTSRVKAYKAEQKSKQDLEDLKWDLGMIDLSYVGLTYEEYSKPAIKFFKKSEIATLRTAGLGLDLDIDSVWKTLTEIKKFLAA